MGCMQSVESYEPVVQYDEHGIPIQQEPPKNKPRVPQFIPGFTTKTSTVVYGYVRQRFMNNQVVPIELIELIYLFMKNNCTFIIIFENSKSEHSYLHEIDVESGTNVNLSRKYNHKLHIWKKLPSASYCYGKYNDQTAIYRIAPKKEDSVVCTLKTGKVIELPEIERGYAQTVYSSNHGLFVIGGGNDQNEDQGVNDVLWLNEKDYIWDSKKIEPMIHKRTKHLSLFYESRHYDVSDRIFCLGANKDNDHKKGWEYYDFQNAKWHQMKLNCSASDIVGCGGCIDLESEKLILAGGPRNSGKQVEECNFQRNIWSQIGTLTTYSHTYYPKVCKHNKIVVVFGNQPYDYSGYVSLTGPPIKDYGYVEYIDQRSNQRKWTNFSSLRELMQFTGQQVRDGFYQHMLQM